jgi:thioredoxin 1
MNTKLLVVLIGVLVLGGGVYAYSQNQKEATMMEQKAMEEKAMMEQKGEAAMEGEAMMEKDGAMMEKKDEVMMSKGSYQAYAPEKLAMAESGDVVLFFKAPWCPSCRTLDADIKASMSDIPAGVTILEVDYDAAADLKRKYGVTMQHTLVQVDKDGNQINKWSGGATLEDVLKNVK